MNYTEFPYFSLRSLFWGISRQDPILKMKSQWNKPLVIQTASLGILEGVAKRLL